MGSFESILGNLTISQSVKLFGRDLKRSYTSTLKSVQTAPVSIHTCCEHQTVQLQTQHKIVHPIQLPTIGGTISEQLQNTLKHVIKTATFINTAIQPSHLCFCAARCGHLNKIELGRRKKLYFHTSTAIKANTLCFQRKGLKDVRNIYSP